MFVSRIFDGLPSPVQVREQKAAVRVQGMTAEARFSAVAYQSLCPVPTLEGFEAPSAGILKSLRISVHNCNNLAFTLADRLVLALHIR